MAQSVRLSSVDHDILSDVGHHGTVRMVATHRNAELRGLGLALGRLVRDDLHFNYMYSYLAPVVISLCLFSIRTCFRLLTSVEAHTSSTQSFTIH